MINRKRKGLKNQQVPICIYGQMGYLARHSPNPSKACPNNPRLGRAMPHQEQARGLGFRV
jgi:hypothetical protein